MPGKTTREIGSLRPRFEDRLADEARFIRTWIDNPVLTGAVSPSGRYLARMMARAVDPAGTRPIVELGPGTGPITQALLKRGVVASRLVLVEFDDAFCRLLRKRFPGVRVVQADAYALRDGLCGVLNEPAAAVVSSLPLLNKPEIRRLALLEDAFSLIEPGGSFIQFTYGMNSPVPHDWSQFEADVSAPVWFNLPPARVWIYRRKGEAPVQAFEPSPRDAKRLGLRVSEASLRRKVLFRPFESGKKGLFGKNRNTAR